jgi:hypothetical protein
MPGIYVLDSIKKKIFIFDYKAPSALLHWKTIKSDVGWPDFYQKKNIEQV